MRKTVLLGGLLGALLLMAIPSVAEISAFLDTPIAGPQAGDDLVSGWAFALVDGAPVDVTVRVRIDGVTQNEILCCGPRADVQAVNPDAPLDTGFASLLPYRELAAGPHTVGVEVTAEGCVPVVIERSIHVVKPGGARFIQAMDFSQASFTSGANAFQADAVIVDTATSTVSESLEVEFSSASQSLQITGPDVTTPRVFIANLDGPQIIENGETAASGTALVRLTSDGTLFYRVEVSDLAGSLLSVGNESQTSSAHIHVAPVGTDGDIVFFLSPDLPDGPPFVWEGSAAFVSAPAETIDALFNAELYIDIHTQAHPNGATRGQIVVDPRNCQDPTRRVFAPGGSQLEIVPPFGPGPGQGTLTVGCRAFSGLGPIECEAAWQVSPGGGPVSCMWRAEDSACVGCGPNNEADGVCTNTCE